MLDAVRRRVSALGETACAVLDAASVVGHDFGADLLGELVDAAPADIVATLDRAEQAALIKAYPGRGATFDFAHALIGQALYEDQATAGRAAMHRRVAEVLSRAEPPARAGELARHWYESSPRDPERALAWAERAGREALEQLEPEAAERWYRQALDLAGPGGDPARRCELLIGLGAAQRHGGDPDFRQTLLDAARLAGEGRRDDLLVSATLANTRGFVSASGEVDEERVAMLGAALEALGPGDSPDRAVLLARLATELTYSGIWARRRTLGDEALALARRLGDRRTLCEVLIERFVPSWTHHTLPELLEFTAENVGLADQLGDPLLQFYALHWRGVAAMLAGDLGEAKHFVERERRVADRLADPSALLLTTIDEANLAIVFGHLDEAEQTASRMLEIATQTGQPDGLVYYANQLTNIRYEQGRLAELQEMVAQGVAANPGIPAFRALLALAYVEGDLHEEAAQMLTLAAVRDFDELPDDVVRLPGLVMYAHVCAEVGDQAAAAKLLELLVPWREQVAFTAVSAWGTAGHAAGRLAVLLGRHEEAEDLLTQAATLYERMGAPIWQARAQLDIARLCLARRREDDRRRALELLERVGETAPALGAAGVERRAVALRAHLRAASVLRANGGSLRPLSPSRRATDPPVAAELPPSNAAQGDRSAAIERTGDFWALRFQGQRCHVKDSRGVRYLARLLAEPGVALAALELSRPPGSARSHPELASLDGEVVRSPSGDDAGSVLDGRPSRPTASACPTSRRSSTRPSASTTWSAPPDCGRNGPRSPASCRRPSACTDATAGRPRPRNGRESTSPRPCAPRCAGSPPPTRSSAVISSDR